MTSPRILMVLTSHDQMGNTGEKTGFWLEEFASPYYVFVDAGAKVTLASIQGGLPPIDPKSNLPEWETETTRRFKADTEANKKLQNTLAIVELNAGDYDAIFLPGGHGPMWDFAPSTTLANLIKTFDEEEKVISAVCHASAALVAVQTDNNVPLVKGRQLTSFTDSEERTMGLEQVVPFLLETRLRELGADFKKSEDFQSFIVRDSNLITGQNPASSGAAAEEVLNALD